MPFRDVLAQWGHRRLVDLLARSVARDSLPPSLIFAGPPGGGAREAALALAQALNCERPGSSGLPGDACGTCVSCARIGRGVHPDVLVLGPGDSGSIKIDVVRAAIEQAAYRPFEGKRRVVVIDEADTLVVAAQNALLKTLEEPTASSVFVLVTARPDMLLITVRSRCVLLRFSASSAAAIDGDARDAAGQVLEQVASSPDARRRIDVAKSLAAGSGGGAADRATLGETLTAMASLLRDAALVAARGDAAFVVNADVRPLVDRLARAFGGERGDKAYAAVRRALEALDRNAGVKIVADWLVLEL